jgi:hypothetical protein
MYHCQGECVFTTIQVPSSTTTGMNLIHLARFPCRPRTFQFPVLSCNGGPTPAPLRPSPAPVAPTPAPVALTPAPARPSTLAPRVRTGVGLADQHLSQWLPHWLQSSPHSVVVSEKDEIPECCQPTRKDPTTNTVMFLTRCFATVNVPRTRD